MMSSNYLLGTCSQLKMKKPAVYLIEGKCTDTVRGQLYSVQHGDLDHTIGLRST